MQSIIRNTLLSACLLAAGSLVFSSCKDNEEQKQSNETEVSTPAPSANLPFSADSAYHFIEQQVAFGPRVPNTAAHDSCALYLERKLESYGAKVEKQETTVTAYDSTKLHITNIIGSFNPDEKERILLIAHWDTRPVADKDPVPSLQKKPILGADDGGSGVAVLLEIARLMQLKQSTKGIDILFVDAEDYGTENVEDSWCLGSTYWSNHPHVANYQAKYGILLDMVGGKNAVFRWEGFSKEHAISVLENVWNTAASLGYGKYFVQADGAYLTDDHVTIIRKRKIPTIDIVNYDPNRAKGFGDYWHTHNDNMQAIDKNVLQAVGNTVWTVINQ